MISTKPNNNIKIFNDDCFNILPTIKEKSVDLVLVDLPYNQTSCKWDCMIDLKKMWIELKRCCKKNANYVFFTTTKFGYKLIQSNEKWFRYDLVWAKNRKVGFLSANKRQLRAHEMVYVFGDDKHKKGTYNPQKTKGKPYKRGVYQSDKTYYREKGKGKPHITTNINNKGDRHPTSIIEHPEKTILKFNNPKKSIHRTAKPIDLCEWLIKSYSNEGDVVLDFTAGSGTTGIASLNTKRKCILIEKNKDIFNIIKERLDLYNEYGYDYMIQKSKQKKKSK